VKTDTLHPLRTLRILLPAAVLALLVACGGGGGVDGGGTGAPTALSSGPINGFGSIVVGGVRFDDSSAEIDDLDGKRRSRDELRLGMTVSIESGAIDDAGLQATARRVRLGSEVSGIVSAVDLSAQRFTVLGQRIDVDDNTVFDERFATGLRSLAAGQAVEVYAEFDAALQRFRATRVEPLTLAGLQLRVRGPVAELNPTSRTLRIGSASYRYERASDVPAALAVGSWVRLQLVFDPNPLALWEVQGFAPALPTWADADDGRIEGLISAIAGSTLVVGGRTVDASGLVLPPGLAPGSIVELRGSVRGGVLRATRISLRSEDDRRNRGFEASGPITAADLPAGSIVVRGLSISTRRSDLRLEGGSLADLVVGRRVEVRALLAADRRTLEATRITLR
jgi:hypothetical protein